MRLFVGREQVAKIILDQTLGVFEHAEPGKEWPPLDGWQLDNCFLEFDGLIFHPSTLPRRPATVPGGALPTFVGLALGAYEQVEWAAFGHDGWTREAAQRVKRQSDGCVHIPMYLEG